MRPDLNLEKKWSFRPSEQEDKSLLGKGLACTKMGGGMLLIYNHTQAHTYTHYHHGVNSLDFLVHLHLKKTLIFFLFMCVEKLYHLLLVIPQMSIFSRIPGTEGKALTRLDSGMLDQGCPPQDHCQAGQERHQIGHAQQHSIIK